ncbi:MAG: right-handed parallel beta-helix repeat-containing protein, partial [Planctomycetales bacterium]|nr:right-handed parallel beta-helix repeat-containing protein [Planctomycetales bacterium]
MNILNPQIDLVIIAGTTIRDSFIGLELLGVENGDLRISNSPLRNNSFGLFAQNCSLTFDNDNVGKKWRLEDNATGIIAYGGDITFDNATISGSRGWGVVLSGAKVLAKDSQFRNNGSGLYVKKAPDARFINCSFVDNSGTNLGINNAQLVNNRWEATAGATVLRDCTIARGGYGIWCDHTWIGGSAPELKVFNTTICNNDLGIYSTNGNVEFTGEQGWEFRDNKHHIYAVRGACSLDGVTLSGASVEALTAVGTDLVVKNSELARSGVGLVAWACPSFVARSSKFLKNTMFGAKIHGAATFRGCEIRENGDFSAGDGGGLLLYATNEADHDLRGTRIEDNYVGVRVQTCDWRLTPDNAARWTFPENEFASLQAYDAKLIAKGVEFAGNHCYALSSMSSDVELVNCEFHDNDGGAISWADRSFSAANCKFTDSSGPGMTVGYGPVAISKCRFERNGRQGLLAHYNSRVDLEDSRFTGNGDFGVFLKMNQPTATWDDKNLHRVVDCEIDKNQYGLRVVHAEDHNFELKNTSISGSAWYSIMYDTCSLTVSDQKKNEWTVTGNTCGPCVRYGDVTLDSVNSENNWNIGFLVEQGGRATLRNCRTTGAKYGLYQNNSTQTILDSCRFEGQYTNNWKWAVYVEGGPLTAINSVFAGFHQGFWSGHLRGPSDAKRLFLNNTVADLRSMGNGVQASACHTTV